MAKGVNERAKALSNVKLSGPGYDETACNDVYIPTIEEKLDRLEKEAEFSINRANNELAKVARIRTALKKNPALSDLYSLMKF